jgi:hypothetical protein
MPRYFYDLPSDPAADHDGFDVADRSTACLEAVRTMGELLKELPAGEQDQELRMTVREEDRVIFQIEVSLRILG